VIDHVEGSEYALGPNGRRTTLEAFSYYRELCWDALREGASEPALDDGDLPFDLSSCGPNAVLHVANALGVRVGLLDIIDRLDDDEVRSRATSLARLAELIRSLGLAALPARASWNDLERFTSRAGCMAIAHFDRRAAEKIVGDTDAVHDHWAVVDIRDGRAYQPVEEGVRECMESRGAKDRS
jgi:hypothetical protein